MLFLIWTGLILCALWLYFHQVYSRFSKHGVKHFKPIPILGNMARLMFRIDLFTDDIERNYNAFPKERFTGKYDFINPTVVIRDIELAKQIGIKDFDYFLDHRIFLNEKTDPFFGRSLISLKGNEWKDMRSTLSPVFTSSKIRFMVPLMVEVGNQMIEALKKKIDDSGGYVDIEGKDLSTRYANDVIASCAFGLKVDSQTDDNNEFYMRGKEISKITFIQLIKMFGFMVIPKIMAKLNISLFPEHNANFFKSVIKFAMNDREENKIVRPDLIHLLMEVKKGRLSHDSRDKEMSKVSDAGFAVAEESSVGKREINKVWSDNDLIAQAILFFVAGFDTVSSAMAFALHELTLNPDVQEKLVQEIKENDRKFGGKFDFDSIQNMVYLDMVVSEVLRLWPPAVGLDRLCIKDYNLGRPNSEATEDFIIRKGEGIAIPVWAFHRDPNYFPDPLKFDPERFSEENKHNIKPYTYMPFGIGPRNCIGSRFALCEVKVMLYQLLQRIELSPCDKTCMSSELDRTTVNLRIKGGHWMRIKIRK
ncbi:cytochrome P450 9e2-like isoform X2 [Galleria mellonella]|uniref:unspecific monooxygenase n=1 Tax=Galleria mellonella TaxID=7137 RepID=A0A6J1WL10_GALME|nr:cytochrome P450 9e2-like isoform X2 [Galleria mellonella]